MLAATLAHQKERHLKSVRPCSYSCVRCWGVNGIPPQSEWGRLLQQQGLHKKNCFAAETITFSPSSSCGAPTWHEKMPPQAAAPFAHPVCTCLIQPLPGPEKTVHSGHPYEPFWSSGKTTQWSGMKFQVKSSNFIYRTHLQSTNWSQSATQHNTCLKYNLQ